MNMSSEALRVYLKHANIYKGSSSKKKTDLTEMIVYGCITDKLSKNIIEDISIKQANQISSKHKIKVESLPGYGNSGLKKKENKPYVKEKPFIKIWLNKN